MESEELQAIVKEVINHIAPKCGMKIHTEDGEPLKLQHFSNSGAFSYPLRASVGDFVVDNFSDVYLVKSVYFKNKVCDITMMKVGRDEDETDATESAQKLSSDKPVDEPQSAPVNEVTVTESSETAKKVTKKSTKKTKSSKK